MIAADGVVAVLLAAGSARRFGGGKLDADLGGRPLGAHALATLHGFAWRQLALVTDPNAPAFMRDTNDVSLWINPDPARGIGSSLAVAAGGARAAGAGALLVMLADMPLVSHASIVALLDALDPGAGITIAAALYRDGSRGVPALFAASEFTALAACAGDRGAGGLLSVAGSRCAAVAMPPDELVDIDTPADLARIARPLTYP